MVVVGAGYIGLGPPPSDRAHSGYRSLILEAMPLGPRAWREARSARSTPASTAMPGIERPCSWARSWRVSKARPHHRRAAGRGRSPAMRPRPRRRRRPAQSRTRARGWPRPAAMASWSMHRAAPATPMSMRRVMSPGGRWFTGRDGRPGIRYLRHRRRRSRSMTLEQARPCSKCTASRRHLLLLSGVAVRPVHRHVLHHR